MESWVRLVLIWGDQMKMMQQEGNFKPIALVLETEQEAQTLWGIVLRIKSCTPNDREFAMGQKISDWLSNEAHF